jgi:hypothetical protein
MTMYLVGCIVGFFVVFDIKIALAVGFTPFFEYFNHILRDFDTFFWWFLIF